ncbi:uncharacterized protein LOC122815687 [Protopterus annectens]|uniref:uncharacterized protein LOC122815687 n=1 Tax=Protopterus annectens TaxID=7888 RepID=UPI001CFBE246|nr:uncharacterized protein LOC122815687 [Protopterus annectens]
MGKQFDILAYQELLSMVFALQEINKNQLLLPNYTIGFQIYDSCFDEFASIEGMFQLLSGEKTLIPNYCCKKYPPVAVIIGDSLSSQSIPVARILGLYRFPQLSHASAIPILSDKHQFPSFLRTVVSVSQQPKGLAQLLIYFQWEWVGILATGNDYGIEGNQQLKEELRNSGFCIAFNEIIPPQLTKSKIISLVHTIKESSATVIVIYAFQEQVIPLMEEITHQNISEKIWVASASWIFSAAFSVKTIWKALHGTIGLAAVSNNIPGFKDFLYTIHPDKFPSDIFMTAFWETAFQCKWTDNKTAQSVNLGIIDHLRYCTGQEKLQMLDQNLYPVSDFRFPYSMYNAIYAVAHSLQTLLACKYEEGSLFNMTCTNGSTFQPQQVLHHLRKVHFKAIDGEDVFFDGNGDVIFQLDIINWQLAANGSMEVVTVGHNIILNKGHFDLLSKGFKFIPSTRGDLVKTIIDMKLFLRKINLKATLPPAPSNTEQPQGGLTRRSIYNPPLLPQLKNLEMVLENGKVLHSYSAVVGNDRMKELCSPGSKGTKPKRMVPKRTYSVVGNAVVLGTVINSNVIPVDNHSDRSSRNVRNLDGFMYDNNFVFTESVLQDKGTTCPDSNGTLKDLIYDFGHKLNLIKSLQIENSYLNRCIELQIVPMGLRIFKRPMGIELNDELLTECNTLFDSFGISFMKFIMKCNDHKLANVIKEVDRLNGVIIQDLVPKSVCSETCHPGYRKVVQQGQAACCFDCIPCSDGEISNISGKCICIRCPEDYWPNTEKDFCIMKYVEFLSYEDPLGTSLAVIAVVFSFMPLGVLCIFIKHQDTPVVKANNREVSYFLLISNLFCLLTALIFIGPPNNETCIFRQPAFGIFFSICVSAVLAKTVTVVIAFNATKPGSRLKNLVGSKTSFFTIFCCFLFQFIICIVWISVSPPFSETDKKIPEKTVIQCNEGSVLMFYCMLGYLGMLATVSLLIAFLARNLPDSFNETKFITFSMIVFVSVWLTFVPAYISTKGKYMVAVEIFAILSSSIGLLLCIFSPKCYIILIRPDMNTRGYIVRQQNTK